MRRVENLIKKKGSINTFNKLKTCFYLNKQFSKKLLFVSLKYKFWAFFFKKTNRTYILTGYQQNRFSINIVSRGNKPAVYKITTMLISIYIY